MAYIKKLVKAKSGVKNLLVLQDLSDRTVDAKRMKTKDSEQTVRPFLTMITKKTRPKVIWVDKRTEFVRHFKKLCTDECIQIYSTISETNAAFAERTIGPLEDILHHYMEDNV